jgi:hypothetical protein
MQCETWRSISSGKSENPDSVQHVQIRNMHFVWARHVSELPRYTDHINWVATVLISMTQRNSLDWKYTTRRCIQKFPDWPSGARTAASCSCIAILRVSLVRFAAIILCAASQRLFIIVFVVYFVIDSVRKLLDTPSYCSYPINLTRLWNVDNETSCFKGTKRAEIKLVGRTAGYRLLDHRIYRVILNYCRGFRGL